MSERCQNLSEAFYLSINVFFSALGIFSMNHVFVVHFSSERFLAAVQSEVEQMRCTLSSNSMKCSHLLFCSMHVCHWVKYGWVFMFCLSFYWLVATLSHVVLFVWYWNVSRCSGVSWLKCAYLWSNWIAPSRVVSPARISKQPASRAPCHSSVKCITWAWLKPFQARWRHDREYSRQLKNVRNISNHWWINLICAEPTINWLLIQWPSIQHWSLDWKTLCINWTSSQWVAFRVNRRVRMTIPRPAYL